MAHQESERGFGKYEVAVGGGGSESGDEAEVFTYDLDENGGIVNFERLEDSKAKSAARRRPEPEEELESETAPESEEESAPEEEEHGQAQEG